MAAVRTARLTLALVLVAVIAVMPLMAGANHMDVQDPNDTRGQLDIKRVEVHGTGLIPLWKVITGRSWSSSEIFEKGFVLIFFDTFGTNRFDYYALARSTGRQMVATLYRNPKGKRDRKVSRLHDWRSTTRSLSVRIPLKKMRLGEGRLDYRWYAQTLFTGNHCRAVCFDFAPNNDAVVEPRPDVTPTLSP
jgi:hypothetical protein